MIRLLFVVVGAGLVCLQAPTARAQINVTVTPGAPALGAVIAAPTPTVFTVTPAGEVITVGAARRVRNDPVIPPRVAITCTRLLPDLCAVRRIRVTIAATGGSPAAVTHVRASNFSTPLSLFFSPPPVAGGSSVSFVIYPLNLLTMSFDLGLDVTLTGQAPSGTHTFNYVVTAEFLPLL